ncbi:hypothetical protein HIM_05568 [Hirsutella minnesotensis 3608]|uniref:CN hydrolase domain-containing protein n=1 Tax=Hirsutella minnesotensis 3608 TaxID=1043627 RepID=A0A0F8A054_9HYPO|nr:hypothetical protein HIM_05568 [Hirsutella minnesotensis 3608]
MAALAAVGQICSTASVKANLDQCVRLVGRAAAGGAKILFLPEASDYIAPGAQASLELATPQSTSPFVTGLRAAAKQHSVAVHVGIHHPIEVQSARKLVNRALYINAQGAVEEAATYDKLHVFDYGSLRESKTVEPGGRLTAPFDSPVGGSGGSSATRERPRRAPSRSSASSRWTWA